MFKNFDEVEQTLLKVLQDLADITTEAKKIQEQEQKQEKQKGGCASCDDCLYDEDEEEDDYDIKPCSECEHYDDCGCAEEEENDTEKEEFKNKMNWLEQCRRAFLEDFVDWIAALPYLSYEMVDDINSNHVQIVRELNKCFAQQVEPSIAMNIISKGGIGIADIFKAFNLVLVDTSKDKDEEKDKSKEKVAKVSNKEKDLLNALKNSSLYTERKR